MLPRMDALQTQADTRRRRIAKLEAIKKSLENSAYATRCRDKAIRLVVQRTLGQEVLPALKKLESEWDIATRNVCERVVKRLEGPRGLISYALFVPLRRLKPSKAFITCRVVTSFREISYYPYMCSLDWY